ncbi:MAG: hypothetical protein NTY15_19225 [Planctomycetota bacterium]|nr:hypothetical protein [Planctomycetota bacterium]
MTFRRRLLIATVTLGGGICCCQPIMRSRMESRLSEIMKAKVEIGSSKISLIDGTIALRNVVVHSVIDDGNAQSSSQFDRIPYVALKFDWNSLLYRNLKVNSVIATDVHWMVAEPTSEFIPFAVESPSQSPLPEESKDIATFALVIEPILHEMKQKIAFASSKQSQSQLNVATRIRDMLQHLAEAMPSDGSLNVLRQQDVVEKAKIQLASINQLMAEDRVAYKKSEKELISLTEFAPEKLLQNLAQQAVFTPPKITVDAMQLAKSAIAREWNQNRSVLQLALQSITALRESPAIASKIDSQVPTQVSVANSEFVSKLPVGFTRLLAGKVKGTIQFTGSPADSPESNSEFELVCKNLCSRDLADVDKPIVNIRMTRDSQSAATPWLTCTVQEMECVQSDSTQLQVVVQRILDARDKSVATIQHANQGWSAKISIPLGACVDLSETGLRLSNPSTHKEARIVGKLIGTTSAMSGDQNEILIEIEPSSLEAIEAVLKPSYDLDTQRKLSQAKIRGTEQLHFELEKINGRWKQLSDEHDQSHQSWAASVEELNAKLEQLLSAFKRTARATAGQSK